jgi:hypothetical protein
MQLPKPFLGIFVLIPNVILICASTLFVILPERAIAAASVYPGCSAPQEPTGRALHAAAGAITDGNTANSPMSIERALRIARGGDMIYLAGGNYGVVLIEGKNAGFVTVTSEPGQHPILEGIKIGGYRPASHWIVEKLAISGPRPSGLNSNGWQNHPFLVEINNSSDIIINDNTIETTSGKYTWGPEVQGESSLEQLMSGVDAENSNCVAVVNNIVHNIFNGIAAGGDQTNGRGTRLLISRNHITEFSGDGIDHFGSNVAITSNTIENGHDQCKDLCIHNDGIQGWNYNNRTGIINSNVVISGNSITDRSEAIMAQPADDLHGITIFDGNWDNVAIENNAIVTFSWHGISLYGVNGATVLNNTVLSPDPRRSAWILIHLKKGDKEPTTYVTTVRNNIASTINIDRSVKGVISDHNLVVRDPKKVVAVFDPELGKYDLHLSKNSAAIGAGAPVMGPHEDIQGNKRAGKYDIGAYAAASLP